MYILCELMDIFFNLEFFYFNVHNVCVYAQLVIVFHLLTVILFSSVRIFRCRFSVEGGRFPS